MGSEAPHVRGIEHGATSVWAMGCQDAV